MKKSDAEPLQGTVPYLRADGDTFTAGRLRNGGTTDKEFAHVNRKFDSQVFNEEPKFLKLRCAASKSLQAIYISTTSNHFSMSQLVDLGFATQLFTAYARCFTARSNVCSIWYLIS